MSDIAIPDSERRLVLRLLRYWQDKRGVREMPEENDIDPADLVQDWDFCFLLQTRDMANTQDYNFTYLGQNILEAYLDGGIDDQNQFLIGPNAFLLSDQFSKVLVTRAPVHDDGEFVTRHGRRVLYRQILLPLGGADGEVESVFGGMSYRLAD